MIVRTLTIALLLTALPSFGMAGVITHSIIECDPSVNQSSCSASLDCDETETPDPNSPQRLTNARNMMGMTPNYVLAMSSSSNAIGGSPLLFVKAIPPVESIYGFAEWQFVPDSPVLKIPKVPIGGNDFVSFNLLFINFGVSK